MQKHERIIENCLPSRLELDFELGEVIGGMEKN
jgi:hypothetical protein